MLKIVLVGYMAVGKSTIAGLLAEKMKIRSVDLDQLIENKSQLSINEIFKSKGEIYFRKIEHAVFKETVVKDESLIISTGGGTPCYAENHLLLNGENLVSVYLKASVDTIFDRLKNAKSERPLVAGQSDEELKEFIAKHLFDRSYFYNQATYKVTVDDKSPKAVVDEILGLLG